MHFSITVAVYTCLVLALVEGHGRLVNPPARSSMWRFGWDTPKNYDDNQMFCGGKTHQINLGGKCGICGDPWDEPQPRTTEVGGPFYQGHLVANYSVGQVIDVEVQLTANHRGFFQFKICPVPGFDTEATQECLDDHLLTLAGTQYTNYQVQAPDRTVNVQLQLPTDLDCEHCVFQWRYHAGNSWGQCGDGTGAVGCGQQEEFYGCADVSVLNGAGTSAVPTQSPSSTATASTATASTATASTASTTTTTQPGSSPTATVTTTGATPSSTVSPPGTPGEGWVCQGVAPWDTLPGIDDWCLTNCFTAPPFCPPTHCYCTNEMLKAALP